MRKLEFDSMPSSEFCTSTSPYMDNTNLTDKDKVEIERICAKHGIGHVFINKTFGSRELTLVLYIRTDSPSVVDYLSLHACINEIDNCTNVLFSCGWRGNCGIFADDNVRSVYYCGDCFCKWDTILRIFPPTITDVRRKLKEGSYLIVDTHQIKLLRSNVFDGEFNVGDVVEYASKRFTTKCVGLEIGKRQCDSGRPPYECVVVRSTNGEYLGAMEFKQTQHGIVRMKTMRPLCGEQECDLSPLRWREQVENFVLAC